MTLLLAAGNPRVTVFFSDRLITTMAREDAGRVNKSTLFHCGGARLAIGFTGLAKWGTFDTRLWLADVLNPDVIVGESLEGLRQRADRDISPLLPILGAAPSPLTLLICGYHYSDPTTAHPYIGVISNDGVDPVAATDAGVTPPKFRLGSMTARPGDSSSSYVLARGIIGGLDPAAKRVLLGLLIADRPVSAIVGKGLEVVQAAARSEASREIVGEDFQVIVITSSLNESPAFDYRAGAISPTFYGPAVIGPGMRVSDIIVEPRNRAGRPVGSIPKVRSRQMCPCGSGRRYGRCHGKASHSRC